MIDHAERRVQNDEAPTIGRDEFDYEKLIRENQTLQSALDQIIKKVADQEISFRDALSRSSAWGALQEQRATRAVAQLETIERSPSWRLMSKINSGLDRFPRLRTFIKRCVKLAVWTARGQLPSKIKQFTAARKHQTIASAGITADNNVDTSSFFVGATVLPTSLLDNILSFMKENGPVELVLALNFYAGGGAESVALDYAKAYAQNNSNSSVLIVLTDNGPKRKLPRLPKNIMVVDLTDQVEGAIAREEYLFLLMRLVPLKTLHIVNSVVAFDLLKRLPQPFISELNVVSSVFCLQFDSVDDTKIIGFGRDFLPPNIDKIDCVVTDNHMFALEGPLRLGLADYASKFKVVYNKSKLDQTISVDTSLELLNSRLLPQQPSARFKVHWAGRLDRQKRPDLLAEIAALTEDFCDFQVFGGSVVDGDYEAQLRERDNIDLCGPYLSPTEWDMKGKGNVYLFTSREEGMPNALIEAAYLGYPIVASNVGGVGELVNSRTGWPIDKFAPAEAYAEALRQIFHDQLEAKNRTECLIKLAHDQHSEQSYLEALEKIPGYERA
ncbi:glycosyltransferase family 4 protein [Ochrobactrum sp. S1502_03]|uniref:glycosyltransferase family 4 protein n=1 Tax=Ochrobactrum sp. S1502_03 TaxID=3108451 RepID=UPI0037CC1779